MVIIGVLYLTFEKRLLAESGFPADSTAPAHNTLSRLLVGAQVRSQLDNPKDPHLTRARSGLLF
jgi:hypothetical protein